MAKRDQGAVVLALLGGGALVFFLAKNKTRARTQADYSQLLPYLPAPLVPQMEPLLQRMDELAQEGAEDTPEFEQLRQQAVQMLLEWDRAVHDAAQKAAEVVLRTYKGKDEREKWYLAAAAAGRAAAELGAGPETIQRRSMGVLLRSPWGRSWGWAIKRDPIFTTPREPRREVGLEHLWGRYRAQRMAAEMAAEEVLKKIPRGHKYWLAGAAAAKAALKMGASPEGSKRYAAKWIMQAPWAKRISWRPKVRRPLYQTPRDIRVKAIDELRRRAAAIAEAAAKDVLAWPGIPGELYAI